MEENTAKATELTKKEIDELRTQSIFQNYIMTSGRILTGQEKRALKRKIARDVESGKYDKMFENAANPKSTLKGKSAFDSLNKN